MFKELWQHLSRRRKKQFWMLLVLMVVAPLMEVISIGSIVPFLSVLTDPDKIFQNQSLQPLITFLSITNSNQLILPLTIIFIVATIFSAMIRLLLLYVSTRFSYVTCVDLSVDIYRRTLYQDYSAHTSSNSSEVINSIITKTNTVLGKVLVPILALISSTIMMVCIIGVVLFINPQVSLITISTFGLLYFIVAFFTKKSLTKNSQLIADESTKMVKSLQEGLGGIRDVIIDGTQEFYCKIYQNADFKFRSATGKNIFIASSPRYLMEAVGMILITILAYILTSQEKSILGAIPILGALAIAAQKLFPVLQTAYYSYAVIKGAKSSFQDVLNLLNQPFSYNLNNSLIKQIPFNQKITFKDLSFRHTKDSPWILKNVNLTFKKGETIGFIGETGSGKSTLLDILMSLLTPTSGNLIIDDNVITKKNRRSWQVCISHVPQIIYLTDSTIEENVAFGVDLKNIERQKINRATKSAQILEFISDLKDRNKAFIGERGVQLSGGQRQRIGIARALYKDSDVLIFDEATSALDNQTEQKIMEEIDQLKDNKTVFIVAHRITTLKKCDRIIRINKDHTIEILDYNQIGFD
ncbi:ABC transporter ATP-binding protein [Candidatus Pelagibacter sp. Uisw_090]|uniref:ABC transporter ATP-binding protein n=1 Tax=Candidatus Pelagibacter sp. Uisw_090 TaxID=3230993 RepID=UPI0039E74985